MNAPSRRHPLWRQWLLACAVLGLSVYVLLCCVLGFVVTWGENGITGHRWSSLTTAEAKRNGTFVTALDANPSEIDWHGQRIAINEVWVEHLSQRVYTVVLVPGFLDIPINRQLPGYCIGLNLKQGRDVFAGPHEPFFVRDDRGAGFGEAGLAVIFWEDLPDYDFTPINVKLVDGWHGGDRVDIVLTPQR